MNDLINNVILYSDVPSPEENNELAMLARQGDLEAKEKLILGNLRLITQQMHQLKRQYEHLDEDDLFQEGIYGLLRAINTYDDTQSSFSTHAFSWVRAMMLKVCREKEFFHYDQTFYNKYIRYEKLKQAVGNEYNEFTDNELIDYSLTRKDIRQLDMFFRKTCSYEELTESSDDYSHANDRIFDPEDSVEKKVLNHELTSAVENEFDRLLTDRERFVLKNVYGLDGLDSNKMTSVAKLLAEKEGKKPLTRQGIRIIRKNAENKLKKSELLKHFCD